MWTRRMLSFSFRCHQGREQPPLNKLLWPVQVNKSASPFILMVVSFVCVCITVWELWICVSIVQEALHVLGSLERCAFVFRRPCELCCLLSIQAQSVLANWSQVKTNRKRTSPGPGKEVLVDCTVDPETSPVRGLRRRRGSPTKCSLDAYAVY